METVEGDFTSLKRSRSAHLSHLTKLYESLETNMISYDNVDIVKDLYSKLVVKFERFKTAHLQCLDCCTDSALSESLKTNFAECKQNFLEFRKRFEQWTAAGVTTPEDDDDRVSVVSNASSTSSRSQMKSAKAKRLVAEQKLRTMKQKIEIERAKRELELKQQLLESQSELEQARLEESVWTEATEDCDINTSENSTSAETTEKCDTDTRMLIEKSTLTGNETSRRHGDTGDWIESTARVLNDECRPRSAVQADGQSSIRLHETASDATASGIDQAFQRLATTLQEGFNLPKPELLRFGGSSLEYCKFVSNFETNIESKVSDPKLRLTYLIQYCDGEAKRAIEDCVLLEPNEGYKMARDILYSRFGRPHNIARTYIDRLVHGPVLKANDTDNLSNLALEMKKCEITLSQLGFKSDIDNTDNLRRIVKRLPMHVRGKWIDVAHSINESGREPRFSDLAKFVDEKSRIATSMYGLDLAREGQHCNVVTKIPTSKSKPNGTGIVKSFATNSANSGASRQIVSRTCCCCDGKCAELASCKKFTNMCLGDRERFVRERRLCFNCLKGKHFSNACRKPASCTVPECKSKHHLLLHRWVSREFDCTALNMSERTATSPSVNCAATKRSFVKNCLGIVPVTVLGENGETCETYALLDDGADKTLCDERLLKALNLPGRPVTFNMTTASSTGSTFEGREVDLRVRSAPECADRVDIKLNKVWSVKTLPISMRSAPKNSDIRNFPYLNDIKITNADANSVMLLIGTDTPQAHIPLEVRSGNLDQPYAIRTQLGWAIRGPMPDKSVAKRATVNFQQSDVLLQQQLERMWNTDFDDKIRLEKATMSVEDKEALAMMENSFTHVNGHYSLKLPWRDEDAIMPNNVTMAHARLEHLKRKLVRNPELHKMYNTTMTDYIQKGYAEEVPSVETENKRVWYLPHHPVVNENKPGKVRVVFDCAAKYRDASLNDQLLQGPDLMNSLVGVLCRFRQEPVALAADIEAMFHQVRVHEEDRDALRFLWWPGGDMQQQPKCYRMKVHLFGATSSPSCTAYALKRTASDHSDMYEPEVVTTVEKNFYVDDCLKSVPSDKRAISLAADLQSLLQKGGFRLTKWLSNSRSVVDSIPEAERAPSVVNLDKNDDLPVDRALGVHWDVEKDEIKFKVKLTEKPQTRRGILSIVSSIFDPLGLVSPVTLPAKAIVQRLCKEKLKWDDPIPEVYAQQWQRWLDTLPALEQLSVRRCFKPRGFEKVTNVQLHIFCDGSELGYGACAYLRLVDERKNVACSLVVGKSRLAPMKQTSIPRLELSGAVVASRLYGLVADELEISIDSVTFWTDSMIVLGYIKNKTRRFKTFVGNRIGQIHELTSPEQWRHIDTNSNPADIASRGIEACDSENLKFWLNGPEFLLKSEEQWPSQPIIKDLAEDDAEVKREITVNATDCDVVHELVSYFSSWNRLVRAVAWLLRFKDYCKRKKACTVGNLSVNELREAERAILLYVQQNNFKDEMSSLEKGKTVKKNSRLLSLNPVIHNELIRVKGRVNYKDTNACPVILPGNHHVTRLIIRHYHETNGHVGTRQVLSMIRKDYWILKGLASVKKVLKDCFLCKRNKGPLCQQQMAPLLDEQIEPDKPPFSCVGVDFFGPMTVKLGRSHAKRYGCLFTCLTTRAVHIEIAHSLDTNSFIAAFQRFVSRRGRPDKVFSDNGTNLVAGDLQLRQNIQEWNETKIDRHMTQNKIEWHFNPPHASHMGGVWERMIRSTRSILTAIVKEQVLNDEKLLTFMAETEKILNDRPITQLSNDPNDPPALSPSMLLLLRSNRSIPPGVFDKKDVYSRRWWRQIQYLADIFWRRWTREYVTTLQPRQKWQKEKTNLRVGDVVLVAEDNTPRGHWPLARVLEINYGRDGLVRSCAVKTRSSKLTKPVTKLCLLESSH